MGETVKTRNDVIQDGNHILECHAFPTAGRGTCMRGQTAMGPEEDDDDMREITSSSSQSNIIVQQESRAVTDCAQTNDSTRREVEWC